MNKEKFTKESIVILHDNYGIPSIMVKVENTAPSKELADPMFIVRGQEYKEIYLSQYLNSTHEGRAYSLPLADPRTCINMDEAIKACRAKGEKWHLLTLAEWRYIINGTMEGVHGNTDRGKYHGDTEEIGIKSNFGRTLTGSGPASWFHNGSKETGIADVVGNVWKIIAGARLRNGILEYMENNDAAAPDADLSFNSQQFKRIIIDGKPVRMGVNEDGDLCIGTNEYDGYDYLRRKEVKVELSEIPDILKQLGIIGENMDSSKEWFGANAELEEAVLFVSGCFSSTSGAGPDALGFSHPRACAYASLGFFSACLGDLFIR